MKNISKTRLLKTIVILFFSVNASAQPWQKGGNLASVNPPIVGTLSNEPLRVFTNGTEKMRILTGGFVGIGTQTPQFPTDVFSAGANGDVNISSATFPTPASAATLFPSNVPTYRYRGRPILRMPGNAANVNFHLNVAVGDSAGSNVTSGNSNVFVGKSAGTTTTIGSANVYIGMEAGELSVAGARNTCVGFFAGESMITPINDINLTRGHNTFIGQQAGRNGPVDVGGFTGERNTYIGSLAGQTTNSGTGNIALGFNAGNPGPPPSTFALGSGNISIGSSAGTDNFGGTANNNILIGNLANVCPTCTLTNALTNAIAIGANTIVMDNHKMILGDDNINVGIGLSNVAGGPQKRLEINNSLAGTDLAPVNASGSTGLSGLRFTDLTSASTPEPTNPAGTVLSVNSFGDVILVPGGTGGGNVIACTSPTPVTNFLTKWSPAPTICNSQFIDDATTTGINTLNPLVLFNVPASAPAVSNAGIFSLTGTASTTFNTGVQGISNVSGGQINVGVMGTATGTGTNRGGWFAASGGNNLGVYTTVPASGGIAVYGDAGGTGPALAGFFNGEVFINSPVNGLFMVTPSDAIFKQNFSPINDPLAIISQLNPKSFYYDTTNAYHLRLSSQKQYGFVAQEVEPILPELVYTTHKPAEIDPSGNITVPSASYKSLNYQAFIAILTKGMQQQEARISSLESIVSSCCSTNTRTNENGNDTPGKAETTLQVELGNNSDAILYQNEPNPFDGSTVIRYFIPETITGSAYINFLDMYGREVNKLEITERGFGKIEASTENLASGIYSYSMVVDGKTIHTKNMLKTK